MPMLQVYKCPVCTKESSAGNSQPEGWITVYSAGGSSEVFDRWQCVATYAQEQADAHP